MHSLACGNMTCVAFRIVGVIDAKTDLARRTSLLWEKYSTHETIVGYQKRLKLTTFFFRLDVFCSQYLSIVTSLWVLR